MVRQLLVPGLSAVLLVPLAGVAQPCPPCPPAYGTVIYGPVVYGPPVGCVPATGTVVPAAPAAPPTVVPERMEQPKKPQVQAEPESKKPEVAAVPKPADPLPIPVPMPKKEPDKIVPVTGEKIDPPGVPPLPPVKPIPTPNDDLIVPPLGKVVPPEEKKPKEPDGLPKFDIPLPGGAAQPVEANKPSTSKSSPLAEDRIVPVVDVYPRDGAASGKGRTVQFVNKSSRDIVLTVDGQTTTLPSKNVLSVELGTAFTWQIGGEKERSETVPDGRSGVDVVIRK